MLWFRAPEKVYFKKGCLPVALNEVKDCIGQKESIYCYRLSSYIRMATLSAITDKLR